MRKLISLFMLLVVFSLSACGAGNAEAKKAGDFLSNLNTFKTADPAAHMDKLAELSSSVLDLHAAAFNFKNGWQLKEGEYNKYVYIFNADATLSAKVSSDKIERISYTFTVKSDRDIYNSADKLIALYGPPLGVYLNSAPSSHSDVDRATSDGNDPKLTYSYAWKTKLRGQDTYVYEAYYNASGIKFTYIIVSTTLVTTNSSQVQFWK